MGNKTPDYTLKAQKAYHERLRDKGWKYFSVIAPPAVVEKLRMYHKQLMTEQDSSKPDENKTDVKIVA